MIASYLQRHALEKPGEPFLADGAAELSFQDAERQVRRVAAALNHRVRIAPASVVYLHAHDSARLIVTLLATQYCGARVCVLNRDFRDDDLRRLAIRLPQGILITDAPAIAGWPDRLLALDELPGGARMAPARERPGGGVVILTTGTTAGLPKAVSHDWERLLAQVRLVASSGRRRWALLYPLNHFAGLQVLLHVLKNGLSLAIPRSRRFPDVLECLIRCKVDSASATPTFWRMFAGQLTRAAAGQLRLTQITLGGEPVTADILGRLRELFPAARLTQVYATTEIGSCFAVSDGQAGFPSEFLDAPVGNVHLKIREGQLYVRAGSGTVDYVDGSPVPETEGDWVATGDLVEVRGNRVHFLGRKGEVVNVGGVKVYPPIVEEPIRKVRGVQEVRVYGKPNPVTGQILAADVEISEGAAPEVVLAEVRQACRAALSRYEQPREMRVVAELGRSNGKLLRR